MDDQQRPEPVLDEAKLLRVFGLVLAAVVAVLGLAGVVVSEELVSRITTTATVALSAGLAVWSYIGPMWRARRLREQVTPVADPQTADGTPLVPVTDVPQAVDDSHRVQEAEQFTDAEQGSAADIDAKDAEATPTDIEPTDIDEATKSAPVEHTYRTRFDADDMAIFDDQELTT